MPRYFFNINGALGGPDEDGEELPNDGAAWREATIITGEMFKEIDGKLRPGQDWSLEVADESRKPLYTIQINTRQMK
jgi:hypothetical protein